MEKLNLRELKGAPLSIILAIVMAGNRAVSVSYLCTETGYSDKTINSGLDLLRDRRIITQTGRCRYQLTGENVQLPLYWGETVKPVNPSPASDQPALFPMDGQPGNFSGKNSGLGIFPKTGNIPGLEKRVSDLEKRVSDLEKRNFSGFDAGNTPKSGEIPDKTGEFSDLLLKTTTRNNTDIDNDNVVVLADDSGKIPEPEKFRDAADYKKMIGELQDYYLQRDHFGCALFPEYQPIDEGLVDEIAALKPDKRVLEYILPRAENVDALLQWCGLSYRDAKQKLLANLGIYGKYAKRIMANNGISLCEIDFHYWKWCEEKEEHPEYELSIVGHRIAEGFNLMTAKTSDPLKFNWIK